MTYIPGGGGGGGSIAQGSDVALNNVTDGEVLAYDGSLQKWKNAASTSGGTLADGSVTTSKLANNAVGTSKIADGAVTNTKLATSASVVRVGGGGSSVNIWFGGTSRPTGMIAGDYWIHDAA